MELRLFFVEVGVQFTNTYGDVDERFYSSMEKMYASVVQTVADSGNDEWVEEYGDRIRALVKKTEGIGWGVHDQLHAIYEERLAT